MRHALLLMTLVLGFVVTSCQSTKSVVRLPAVREYGQRPGPPQLVASAEQSTPGLAAALPDETTTAPASDQWLVPRLLPASHKPLKAPVDTVRKPLLLPVGKPDPTTTVVNVAGGVTTAAGLGIMIAAANAETGGEWGGLANAIGGFMGLMLMIAGVALLFFQGKNGRLRRLREARKAARRAIVAPATEQGAPALNQQDTIPAEHMRHRSKTGLSMIVAAGILVLLSFLPVGFFLLLPAALILFFVGLGFMIAGH
ncbi:hypothetical protein [Hymenobacter sp. GOD-10R]|uniref:hypothetical protein n=1 Tax=Hymenobacter sp. GOD-10R TaxID=3093922 RepID=UPI002D77D54C|nr:hypothetical protein [Hymenobacter sp. GOD-10R]WRQ30818.1 hypothetical protein SD425_11145 [Hymenobacter sp. GOD-10R]